MMQENWVAGVAEGGHKTCLGAPLMIASPMLWIGSAVEFVRLDEQKQKDKHFPVVQ